MTININLKVSYFTFHFVEIHGENVVRKRPKSFSFSISVQSDSKSMPLRIHIKDRLDAEVTTDMAILKNLPAIIFLVTGLPAWTKVKHAAHNSMVNSTRSLSVLFCIVFFLLISGDKGTKYNTQSTIHNAQLFLIHIFWYLCNVKSKIRTPSLLV